VIVDHLEAGRHDAAEQALGEYLDQAEAQLLSALRASV